MHIVLVEPEIPGNTGNISRLCAAEHLTLHLVEPLGFSIDDKHLKRAGLDYWKFLDIHIHKNFESVKQMLKGKRFFYNTTKAKHVYTDISYKEDDVLVFGKETKGLPEELLFENQDSCIRIPMVEEARSLNLSNAVAIVALEALRQTGFPELKKGNQYLEKMKGTISNEYV
ncbi:tRNA (cytidine(34)-2'-O)-methyltransferase [Dialister micraerophilus]|uniref:tRNA (cytidine(34)-2'-O)-methyltransferase n=1 Tax=Dialister micraerophilus TaxID=309120 RepID=UPI0023F50B57|nr:tRNA (cytidine(34)-2'-O)-methyltransferase [Dialister micraerophilus]